MRRFDIQTRQRPDPVRIPETSLPRDELRDDKLDQSWRSRYQAGPSKVLKL